MFSVAGLGPDDEAVYAALMDGPATVPELSRSTRLAEERVRVALDHLEEAGLVGRGAGHPERHTAAAPDVALEALLLRQEEQVQRARLHAHQMAARHRRAHAGDDPASLVEVVTGRLAVLERFEQVQRAARHEIRAIDKPPYAVPSGNRNPVELAMLARGVRYRVIYDPRGLVEFHDLRTDLEQSSARGEVARVLAGTPTKLILADDRVGLIPLQAAPSSIESIVVVHPSALLEALGALFESLWDRALPLGAAPEITATGPTPDERRLLTLLTTGLPDEAIARQLGLSYRTFQRRLRRLLVRLDAETRFQAGVRAAHLGWIPPDGP
ncbi:TrmB family transcriptional regulator [Krasilnikovia sp. MM14-A1004]|uniref:TrmB family transcriptional regulator n=1 Tax=Krasilnikovia sp. MM14-A1004 TaxID=3373541 RepID=UPI00399CE459